MLHGCWAEPSERCTILPSLDHVVKTRKINDIKITLKIDIDSVSVCVKVSVSARTRKKSERKREREIERDRHKMAHASLTGYRQRVCERNRQTHYKSQHESRAHVRLKDAQNCPPDLHSPPSATKLQ